jgi:hypothetical protein
MEKNELAVACSAYGGRGEECTGFWWGNLRKPRRREEDNIKVDLQEVGYEGYGID